MHIVMDERSAINPSEVRMTGDGYLVTMPRIARTGIQIYAGHEVGRPDLDEVRVYRPPAEVFDEKAMHSYAHRPVTDDHPSEPVTADNWRKFAVGQTGAEVVRDGRFVRVPMVVMDSAAIKKVQGGKTQLSNSYACDLHWEDGVDEEGKPYDAVQRNIRGNHLAIVANARGGADLRIGDEGLDDAEVDDEADAKWNAAGHPRAPAGTSEGGQFISAGEIESLHQTASAHGYPFLRSGTETEFGKKRPGGRVPKSSLRVNMKTGKWKHVTSWGKELGAGSGSAELSQHLQRKRRPMTGTVVDPYKRDSADALAADDQDWLESENGEPTMQYIVDGVSIEMPDTAVQIVKRALADRDTKLRALDEGFEQFKKKKKEEEETNDRATKDAAAKLTTELATKDAEIAKLKKDLDDSKVTPAQLDQWVKDRSDMLTKAKAILGDALVVEGKSDDEIRKQVVLAHVGDAAKDWDAGQLKTSFISITAKIPAQGQQPYMQQPDYLGDAARILAQSPAAQATVEQAYNERNTWLSDAWKKTVSSQVT